MDSLTNTLEIARCAAESVGPAARGTSKDSLVRKKKKKKKKKKLQL